MDDEDNSSSSGIPKTDGVKDKGCTSFPTLDAGGVEAKAGGAGGEAVAAESLPPVHLRLCDSLLGVSADVADLFRKTLTVSGGFCFWCLLVWCFITICVSSPLLPGPLPLFFSF
jgi:hypothetical protein